MRLPCQKRETPLESSPSRFLSSFASSTSTRARDKRKVCFADLHAHHNAKLAKLNEAVAIDVDLKSGLLSKRNDHRQMLLLCTFCFYSTRLIDHFENFLLSWILAERAHRDAELFGGDCSIAIAIKHHESLTKFVDFLWRKLKKRQQSTCRQKFRLYSTQQLRQLASS